jgi:hypothetical protein
MSAMNFARILVVMGIVLIILGGLVYLFVRIGLPLGHLPGDIRIQGTNLTCFIPLSSMIILSIVLTVVLNLIVRFLNR